MHVVVIQRHKSVMEQHEYHFGIEKSYTGAENNYIGTAKLLFERKKKKGRGGRGCKYFKERDKLRVKLQDIWQMTLHFILL